MLNSLVVNLALGSTSRRRCTAIGGIIIVHVTTYGSILKRNWSLAFLAAEGRKWPSSLHTRVKMKQWLQVWWIKLRLHIRLIRQKKKQKKHSHTQKNHCLCSKIWQLMLRDFQPFLNTSRRKASRQFPSLPWKRLALIWTHAKLFHQTPFIEYWIWIQEYRIKYCYLRSPQANQLRNSNKLESSIESCIPGLTPDCENIGAAQGWQFFLDFAPSG